MRIVLLMCCLSLAACDQMAELDGSKTAEADGKAVGGACRHAGRALEDCYTLNERASKSAVFTGWREMNDYMTQNKIDVVAPLVPRKPAETDKPSAKQEEAAAVQPALPDPLALKYPGAIKDANAIKDAAAREANAAKALRLPKEAAAPLVLPRPAIGAAPAANPEKQGH